jgi:Flp pilus assembly protein TadD
LAVDLCPAVVHRCFHSTPSRVATSPLPIRLCLVALVILITIPFAHVVAQESADELFRAGRYDEAMELAQAEVDRGVWSERWPRLLIQCQLARGKYAEALQTYEAAVSRYSQSLTLRLLGREALLYNNRPEDAEREADQIFNILQQSSSRFASSDSLVAAGRYFALRGEDARQVLTLFYDRVRAADPQQLEVHLATAELAIDKGDFQVAAQTLEAAAKIDSQDPRVGFLQARAWGPSDSAKANEALQRSLACNAQFTPSLLLVIDNAIDAERFTEADAAITNVLNINPHDWSAWSYLAVLAHLRGEYEKEQLMRAAALSTWNKNPGVDHLIGKKLSDNYRFEVGAAYQRKSLAFDSSFAPANYQLAQDLLRLGEDVIGWELASKVAEQDPYNVVAHNLMTLSGRLKGFTVLEADGIQVRMEKREAEIYGDRVLDLLLEAKRVLCKKYDVTPRATILVEIYPQQKDFAIRTFGLPGGAKDSWAFALGRVITANSPASQGPNPSNWESVLWHEFCHAVTLEKTQNRMPRWLSEGISVYEERQRDASWGQAISPVYREMLLDEKLTPVSQLSGAFLRPPSPLHLQFAYFQSNLVIEFLIEKYGQESIANLLTELGNGLSINDAIGRVMRPIETIDQQFAQYAKAHALSFGKDADWTRASEPRDGMLELFGIDDPLLDLPNESKDDESTKPDATTADAKSANNAEDSASPKDNVWELLRSAATHAKAEEWGKAKAPLERLVKLGVIYDERGGPLEQLAVVYRELNDDAKELKTLELIDARSSDSLASLSRLIEISQEKEDWRSMLRHAKKWLAVQPLLPTGHIAVLTAAEQLNQHEEASKALLALKRFAPIDPAGLDLKLAEVQVQNGTRRSRSTQCPSGISNIAPRYRKAHQLLLKVESTRAMRPRVVKCRRFCETRLVTTSMQTCLMTQSQDNERGSPMRQVRIA